MKSSADKAWRKVVSVVTAFALAFTMCPASALADEIMGNEKASGGVNNFDTSLLVPPT